MWRRGTVLCPETPRSELRKSLENFYLFKFFIFHLKKLVFFSKILKKIFKNEKKMFQCQKTFWGEILSKSKKLIKKIKLEFTSYLWKMIRDGKSLVLHLHTRQSCTSWLFGTDWAFPVPTTGIIPNFSAFF